MTYNAEEIFRQALAFEDAADVLRDRLAGGPVDDATPATQTLSPSLDDLPKLCPPIVLEALAIELYLKCIATIETGETPKGNHDLWSYFEPLSPASKRGITHHYDEVLAGTAAPRQSIEEVLKESASPFVSFRYLYERDVAERLVYSAGMVATAARGFIRELRPKWAVTRAADSLK